MMRPASFLLAGKGENGLLIFKNVLLIDRRRAFMQLLKIAFHAWIVTGADGRRAEKVLLMFCLFCVVIGGNRA